MRAELPFQHKHRRTCLGIRIFIESLHVRFRVSRQLRDFFCPTLAAVFHIYNGDGEDVDEQGAAPESGGTSVVS